MSADPGSSTSTNASAVEQYGRLFMDNYGAPPIELVSGRGAEVVDVEGKHYLDLLGGIAVNALGHAHPAVVQAVSEQIATLGHVSNYFTHPRVLELAARLLDISGAAADPSGGRVLFCNSGTEANEAVFKLARRHGDYAMVGLAAHGTIEAGRATGLRLVFLAVGDGPVEARRAAAVACDGPLAQQVAPAQAALAEDLQPSGDLNASPATRLHLARVLLGRALAEMAA